MRLVSGLPRTRTAVLASYALAVLLTVAAFFLRKSLPVFFEDRPLLILFMFPILLSAMLGGFGPGMVATLLSAGLIAWYLIPPYGSFTIGSQADTWQWWALIANGVMASTISEFLVRSRRRESDRWAQLTASQAELREHSANLRNMLDTMLEGCQIVDFNWRYTYINEAAQIHNRVSSARLLGRTVTECWPGIESTPVYALEQRCMTQRTIERAELEFRFPDGYKGWYRLIMQPVPEGIAIFSEDITEARKNEEARAELTAYFRGIFEHSPDCIIVADDQRQIVMSNPAANQMFGYPEGGLVGKSVEELMPEVTREDRSLERLELIRGADMQAVGQLWQFQARRIDGSAFPIEIRRSAFSTPSGVFVLGVGRDLTERNRTEQARALLASIVENSEDAIIGKDLGSVITSWNKGAQAIFGYGAREVIGQSILKLIPEDRLREEFGILQHIRRGQSVEHYETVRKTRDGRLIDVSISISPIRDARGAIVGSSKIARDITRTKLLETQLRESQKMEAIGTLASGIAHDFNNILGTVMGNAELARQDAGENQAVQESLGEIRKASVRARDLVNQILTFGRRQATSRVRLPLPPAIEESARLLRATLPSRIEVRVDCAPGTPDVLADATQVQQVLLNLGSNAAHAMQGLAGLIGISVCPVELDAAAAQLAGVPAAGAYARVTVSDNGHGMDESTMLRIFDPFFTTKPKGEGTGLGLSVVRNIMRDHDGCIHVFSEPGKGTRFELHFPATGQSAAAPVQIGRVTDEATCGLRVMYIDDDESVRFVVTRMLAKRGYLVQGYPDALQGLAALRADGSAFDLIVTDVNMPAMSGLELAVIVHAERPDVPVALASGYVTDELRTQAAAAGVQEIIFKAHVADDFCDALQRLARRVARH